MAYPAPAAAAAPIPPTIATEENPAGVACKVAWAAAARLPPATPNLVKPAAPDTVGAPAASPATPAAAPPAVPAATTVAVFFPSDSASRVGHR